MSEGSSSTVISRDGTRIAVETVGSGPPVVLAVGALCDRTTTRELARLLAGDFTVHAYDRRGRGDSDRPAAPPYDLLQEIADLGAVLAGAGRAHVYGHSSGAVLAALAVTAGRPARSLALYEPPWSATARYDGAATVARVHALLAAGRPGDAAVAFLGGAGVPDEGVDAMRAGPGWPAREALAPTLPYDLALVGEFSTPTDLLRRLTAPTLVVAGARSSPRVRATVDLIAQVIPAARATTLAGQGHDVDPPVLAPVLREFFASQE